MTAIVAGACDIDDTQHYQKTMGPAVKLLATNIDPISGSVRADGVIQLSFDRYLLPLTVTRQGFAIYDNTNLLLPTTAFQTIYDPVARTVSITGAAGPDVQWLTPGLDYKLVLQVPPDDANDMMGFRAIDRAPLDRTQNLVITFHAVDAPKDGGVAVPTNFDPPVDFCADVMPIFQTKCSGPQCHGPPLSPTGTQPAASLILTSRSGVDVTAKNRVSQASNTGARSFLPEPPGSVFGVDMAIIAPGDPGDSWLMYKVEMAPHPVIDAGTKPLIVCTPPAGAAGIPAAAAAFNALAPINPAATDSERDRLQDQILGRYMPYPSGGLDYSVQPLTFDEREKIRVWIARNAVTYECGGCGQATAADAGIQDAATD